MQFEKNLIYHVFNQGNNKEQVFFSRENYLFFLKKMRMHLLPHTELLCYCLMPNHFHWLIQVTQPEVLIRKSDRMTPSHSDSMTSSHAITEKSSPHVDSDPMTSSHAITKNHAITKRTLNDSIGILLRSYTRAVNAQEDRTGTLFRPHTKAKTGWIDEFITVDRYRNGPFDFRAFPDDEYGFHCFNYIHDNPKEAKLCTNPTDWEFSSARDFAGLRNGTLCNQALAKALLRLPNG